jgi:LmbE family N-acetylglucosaminyl deacetylase
MGCAGTIAKLVDDGAEVALLTFSPCMDLNPPSLLDEWREATDLLGISSSQMLGLPNRTLEAHRHVILEVLDGRQDYDLILTPATFDEHQDHATVTREAIRAYKHSTILGYELPLNTVRESRLSAYVGLESIDVKLAHATLYVSQMHKPYMSPFYIEALANVRGVQSGHTFAEAFEVIRWIL